MAGCPESLIMIVAAGGYGKSVVASQMARMDCFEGAIWFDCSWVTEAEAQFPLLLAALSDKPLCAPEDRDVLAPSVRGSCWESLVGCLREVVGLRLCLVMDGLNTPLPVPQVELLAKTLRDNVHPDSKLVITTRLSDNIGQSDLPTLVIAAGDLEFSDTESLSLARVLQRESTTTELVVQMRDVARGQAALLSVLLRHCAVTARDSGECVRPPADLSFLLARLARTQLNRPQIELVALCALLRTGAVADCGGGDLSALVADMRVVSEALPLFRIQGVGCSTRFDVHDLLCSAVLDSDAWPTSYVGQLDQALRCLDASNRVEEMFEVLIRHSDRGLIAQWLERRGSDLLARGGVVALEKCFDVIGAGTLVRSPSLVLLHARTLRETFELEAALGKAVVAENLANCDEDAAVALESIMTQARVLLDMGRLDVAATQLERALQLGSDVPMLGDAELLAHAYLAMCYASIGDGAAMARHKAEAIELLDSGCSSEGRGRAVAALAGIAGLVEGRWDVVASIDQMTPLPREASLFLRLQTLGNRGTYLCELGRLEEAEKLLGEVVDGCRASGVRSLEGVYAGSLALVLAGFLRSLPLSFMGQS